MSQIEGKDRYSIDDIEWFKVEGIKVSGVSGGNKKRKSIEIEQLRERLSRVKEKADLT